MASPFAIFRKNQKVMIAVLGVLAMFAFVFIPIIMQGMGDQSGGPIDKVVITTTKFGNLKESDLDRLRQSRQKVLAVLADLGQAAGQYPLELQRQLDSIGPATEGSVVDSWLMARHAQQMGMVISDETVNRFLKDWTRDKVTAKEFQKAFALSPSVKATQFFDMMREELLARQLWESFAVSIRIQATTPSQRWDYFNRVKRMATIEAVPLAVANYVKQIEEPTEEELKKFFEENKDAYPSPESPEPGFHRLQTVALEYFKADVDNFAKPGMATDAEIQQRYEKYKESYDQLYKPAVVEPVKKEVAKETKGADAKATKKDVQETPKSEPKTEPKAPDKSKAPKAKATSAVEKPSPFMLTALQTEKADEKKSPATPAAKPATPAKPEPTAKDQKSAEKPAAAAVKPAEPKAGMSDALKTRIRQDIAFEKILKIFADLREPLDKYQQKRRVYDADVARNKASKEKKTIAPPPSPDFEKLAKDKGLAVARTKPMTQWEARDTEIGMSLVEGRVPVVQHAYQSMTTFRPEISMDAKACYLFWKIDDEKARIPKFEDKGVREEVLRTLKLVRARTLALKDAETLAAQANKAKKTLKQVFADRTDLRVVLPPKFSWMTFGNVAQSSMQRNAEISPVAGVPLPGDEFMKTVFHLEPGTAGAAFNGPQTIAYIVRPSEFTPSYDERWKQFETDNFGKYASVGAEDQRRTVRAWFKEMKDSAGFEWAKGRKPDQASESNPTGEE